MHFLQKAQGVFTDTAEHVGMAVSGSRTFRVFLSNSTDVLLSVLDPSHRSFAYKSECRPSFSVLEPGHAGFVFFTAEGDLEAAVEFTVGCERLMLGVRSPRIGSTDVGLQFVRDAHCTTKRFLQSLPSEFMGLDGLHVYAEGGVYALYVDQVSPGADSVAHIIVGHRSEMQFVDDDRQNFTATTCLTSGFLNCFSFLEFAEWCMRMSLGSLAKAAFLMEFASTQMGLDRLERPDKTFALNLLIGGFVISGALELDHTTFEAELQSWTNTSPPILRSREKLCQYDAYKNLAIETTVLEEYIAAALVLLKTCSLHCANALKHDIYMHKPAAFERPSGRFICLARRDSADFDNNIGVLAEHLNIGHADRSISASGDTDSELHLMSIIQHCVTDSANFAIRSAPIFTALAASLGSDLARDSLQHYREQVPGAGRRFGSDTSTVGRYESWGAEVFTSLDSGRSASPQEMLRSLGHQAPSYKRMATNSKSGEFFFFSGDRKFLIKTVTEREALLLNRMLPSYQHHMRQTPRSLIVRYGGLFSARVPDVGLTYFTVMASVFDSMHQVQETFDVKGSTHNRTMKPGESVGKDNDWTSKGMRLRIPDSARRELRAVHELDVSFLCSFGVMDYSLLIGIHNCSDISRVSAGPGWRDPEKGLMDTGGTNIYFVGLIDFLVAFSLQKKAENLMHVAFGHGEEASCVDPLSYATRQVQFIEECVLQPAGMAAGGGAPAAGASGHDGGGDGASGGAAAQAGMKAQKRRQRCKHGESCYRMNPQHRQEFSHPGDWDWDSDGVPGESPTEELAFAGTLGTLSVRVVAAHHLRRADWMGKSDPYTTVKLGLQQRSTPTVKKCLDPKWDHLLRFAVDKAHVEALANIEVSVWDYDSNKTLQGSDDFLGRLSIPLRQVIEDSPLQMRRRLDDVKQGELSLRLEYFPLPTSPGAACEAYPWKKTCQRGHPLIDFLTQIPNFTCDVCGASLPQGALMSGCRTCNFDACAQCLGTQATVGASGAPASVDHATASALGAQFLSDALSWGQQQAPGGYVAQPIAGCYPAPQAYPGYPGYAPQYGPTPYAAQPAYGGYASQATLGATPHGDAT